MATVKHPTIKGVSYEVPDENLRSWRRAGWICPPKRKPVVSDKPEEGSKTAD